MSIVMLYEWTDDYIIFEVDGVPIKIEDERVEVDGEEYTRIDFEDGKQSDDPWEEAQR